jgi:hypothetical protein
VSQQPFQDRIAPEDWRRILAMAFRAIRTKRTSKSIFE